MLGRMRIYMKRDENLGKVYLIDKNFITPNMPKLQYFSRIHSNYEDLSVELKRELNSNLLKYKGKSKAYVLRKDDGTNILFYNLEDKVIPKTRLNGIASRKILRALEDPRFPLREITQLVKDGFIPVVELWGSDLVEKYDILNGGTNVKLLEELEGRDGYNVSVINILTADYDSCEYYYMHPRKWFKIAREYGLEHAKVLKVTKIGVNELFSVLEGIERFNRECGSDVVEGGVVHVFTKRLGYGMFKLKPLNILLKDVIVNMYTLPPERIEYEVNKIFSSFDPLVVGRELDKYIDMFVEELESDVKKERSEFRFSRKQKKFLRRLFVKRLVQYIIREYPDKDVRWFINHGLDKRVIGLVKSLRK